jgi:AcrR family transcriptional regulator
MRTAPTRAERRAQTRAELTDAAERLFSDQGFHATSLDAVADAAGYTKGAVYSNFSSKEDLFFAVYERRVERSEPGVRGAFAAAASAKDAVLEVARSAARRRGRDDGWLAVFLEFWTHVLRHPEHRARFAAIHARAVDPYVAAFERHAAETGLRLPYDARKLAVAGYALGTGLGLEQLTQPDVIDVEFAVAVQDLWLEAVRRGDGSRL